MKISSLLASLFLMYSMFIIVKLALNDQINTRILYKVIIKVLNYAISSFIHTAKI